MKNARLLPLALTLTLALASCHTSRNAEQAGTGNITTPTTSIAPGQALNAKLKLRLEASGKSVTCGGTYRLLRDSVVQLNLTYSAFILTVNVGTLELTPDSILILDRFDKRYCHMAYSDIPPLRQAGVGFKELQDVFWGTATQSPDPHVSWTYADWAQTPAGTLPQEIRLSLTADNDYTATFTLSKPLADNDWGTRTAIPSDCQQVTPQAVLDAVMSIAK